MVKDLITPSVNIAAWLRSFLEWVATTRSVVGHIATILHPSFATVAKFTKSAKPATTIPLLNSAVTTTWYPGWVELLLDAAQGIATTH